MKLNKELMTRWIEALESGRYRQGREALKVKDNNRTKYCCLGVLQKIEPSIPCLDEDESEFLKPSAVEKILGCKLDQHRLAKMNDGDENGKGRKSFLEIAQHLRETYKIG